MQVRLYEGHREARRHRHRLQLPGDGGNGRYLMSPSPIPAFDNPKMHRMPALAAVRRGAGEEDLRRAALHRRRQPRFRGLPLPARSARRMPCALCGATDSYLDEVLTDDAGRPHVQGLCSDTDYCDGAPGGAAGGGMSAPLLSAEGLSLRFGSVVALRRVSRSISILARLWRSSAESGSGKDDAAARAVRPSARAGLGPRALPRRGHRALGRTERCAG